MVLPAHLCIDVEPNDREVAGDPASDWSATGPCVEALEAFRGRLRAAGRQARFNWFLRCDPQVQAAYGSPDYAFRRFRPIWDRALAAGDGLGVHTHAWRIVDGQWSSEHGDGPWVAHCVTEGLNAFERCMQRPAALFRFGDHFLSNDVVRLLARRGVRYEMTLEPGIDEAPAMRPGEAASGALPDYRGAPRAPYRPSRSDYRKPARLWPRPLRMIPVSTGCAGADPIPAAGGHFYHLNLAADGALMQGICTRLLAHPSTAHLCWVARTGDFAQSRHRDNFLANLDYLAGTGLDFLRPDEAWD